MLITILATAIVLGVLIFVHELGHFVTAKMVDIEVPRFSIGFGPKVLGFRRGETEYVLSLLPLGGYVKMAGMEDLEAIEGGPTEQERAERAARAESPGAPRGRDFESKSLPARTLVISAGVIMNLLFAVVAFSLLALIWGVERVPEPVVGNIRDVFLPEQAAALASVPRGARITAIGDQPIADFEELRIALSSMRAGPTTVHFENGEPIAIEIAAQDSTRLNLMQAIEPLFDAEPVINEVVDGSPAAITGLRPRDRILSAGGLPITSWQEFVAYVEDHPGESVPLRVQRGGEVLEMEVTPESVPAGSGRPYGRIGVYPVEPTLATRTDVGPLAALGWGTRETWRWVRLTVDFVVGLFGGRHSARSVGGPIQIAQISGEAAKAGIDTLLRFMALLSVNLAVLNLLPIPVLDGGQLVFLGIEAVRGRALSLQQRMRWSQVGFIIILAIMAFAIGNDLLRWIGV